MGYNLWEASEAFIIPIEIISQIFHNVTDIPHTFPPVHLILDWLSLSN